MRNIDLKDIYNDIDERRSSLNITWPAATLQISRTKKGGRSIALSTIKGLNTKKIVEGDGVLQVLLWLNRTPESFIKDFENPNADCFKLPNVPQGLVLRWDTKALYLALKAKRETEGISWKGAATQIGGYSPAMLANLKKSTRVAFPDVMNIVTWLNQPAVNFTRISNE